MMIVMKIMQRAQNPPIRTIHPAGRDLYIAGSFTQ